VGDRRPHVQRLKRNRVSAVSRRNVSRRKLKLGLRRGDSQKERPDPLDAGQPVPILHRSIRAQIGPDLDTGRNRLDVLRWRIRGGAVSQHGWRQNLALEKRKRSGSDRRQKPQGNRLLRSRAGLTSRRRGLHLQTGPQGDVPHLERRGFLGGEPGSTGSTRLRGGSARCHGYRPPRPRRLFTAAQTSGEVYASNDNGDSWTALPCRLPRIFSLSAFVRED